MAEALQLKEARLGRAPPKSTLTFGISKAKGFVVNALLECDMKLVASWESIEIAGKETEEELIPRGVYTLQVSIAYTSTEDVPVEMTFSIASDDVVLRSKKLSFHGKKGDIGRAVAFVRITTD